MLYHKFHLAKVKEIEKNKIIIFIKIIKLIQDITYFSSSSSSLNQLARDN